VDELNETKCSRVREILTEILDDTADSTRNNLDNNTQEVDGERVSIHLQSCARCQNWQAQTEEMVDMARLLPQFDVSERLTQSILAQVAVVESSKQQQLSWIVYAAAVALFLYVMLFVDAFESVWGIGSWIVGLGTMMGLKLLIAEPRKESQVV
jgi:predicted anti-sigma-YlaC factor YlaD